jgi:Zn-dependent membrane protease YugP
MANPTIMIWVIFIGFMILSWVISFRLKSKFKKYSKIPLENGMSGKEVAEKMLRDSGIFDVKIESVPGQLTDHYNPANKTINLSPEVYNGRSVASAAVAAHETGHAVQHAKAYAWLGFRSNLVPVVSFASRYVQWILLGGILVVQRFPALLLAGIILFALTTIFSFITLPVEINASKRALVWLSVSGITTYENHDKATDALKWAAYTYVVAALASLATLLYYIMIYLGVRD